MKVYELQQTQFVPRPLDEVFAFFSKPENLEALSPPSLRFRTLTPGPLIMREGLLVDYALRIRGIPVHWRTYISDYDPPHRFVDQQLKGPYAFWHHTHTFKEAEGGTEIGDRVRYGMPFGPLGRLVHALYVDRDVRRIFASRQQILAEIFRDGS